MKKQLIILGLSLVVSSAAGADCPEAKDVLSAVSGSAGDAAISGVIKGAIPGVDSAYFRDDVGLAFIDQKDNKCHYGVGGTKLINVELSTNATKATRRK